MRLATFSGICRGKVMDKDSIKKSYTGAYVGSPIKAIRAYCLHCCMYSANEVTQCTATGCVLYPFRFGKNVYSNRTMTDEQRAAASERLAKARSKK